MYLIEISGSANDMELIPTFDIKYVDRLNGELSINISAITKDGFDGAVKLHNKDMVNIILNTIASGIETTLQVKKRYIWQMHKIKANVPVQTYCDVGLFRSITRFIFS